MWYAARLLLESVITGVANPPPEEPQEKLFEEDVFLLQADDEDSALKAACDIGYRQEQSFRNGYGQTVMWRFVAVADLKELIADEIGHGTEVYYRFIGTDQVDKAVRWSRPSRSGSE